MAKAALLLATEPWSSDRPRDLQPADPAEFGWIESARGRGVDSRGSGYSEI